MRCWGPPKTFDIHNGKNTDFLGSMDWNPFNFRHFDINNFAMYVNGRQIRPEDVNLLTDHEKTSIMGYRTLFQGFGIHHSNSGLQITPDKHINGFFMLLFDLTPDLAASEGHTSDPVNSHIRLELKFGKDLIVPLVCLLYLEYDNSVLTDVFRTVTKHI